MSRREQTYIVAKIPLDYILQVVGLLCGEKILASNLICASVVVYVVVLMLLILCVVKIINSLCGYDFVMLHFVVIGWRKIMHVGSMGNKL